MAGKINGHWQELRKIHHPNSEAFTKAWGIKDSIPLLLQLLLHYWGWDDALGFMESLL
jgi:hypothetical protein